MSSPLTIEQPEQETTALDIFANIARPQLVRFPAVHHGPQPEGGLIADAVWTGFPLANINSMDISDNEEEQDDDDADDFIPPPPTLIRQITNNHLNNQENDDSVPPISNLSRQSSVAISPLTFGFQDHNRNNTSHESQT
jgi:hypothetical protein